MIKSVILLTIVIFYFAVAVKGDCLAGGMTSSGSPEQISPLECKNVLVSDLPFQPSWGFETAQLVDANNKPIGFTMVMPSTDGPQYNPSNLNLIQPGVLSVLSATGLFSTMDLENALGVGLMMYSPLSISTSFVLPPSQGGMEQAGLWIGLRETDYVNLVVVSNSVTQRSILSLLEIGGDVRTTITFNLPETVNQIKLWMEADLTSMSITTYYSIDDSSNKIQVWRHDQIPPEWFGLGDAVILDQVGTNTFGGIYASRVNLATPSVYNFTSFEVNQLPLYPNNPDGCYPYESPYLPYGLSLSTLDCSEVGNGVDTTRVLTFQGDNGGIKDKNGVGTGLTMSLPSEDGNSILAYDLTTGDGLLRYAPTTTIPQGNVYELNNALGLGVSPRVPQKISVTIVKLTAGTGNYEQAGIAIGVSQRSCIKFQLMSEQKSNPTMFILRLNYRINGVVLNTFNINNFMTGATDTDPGTDITLSFTTDPVASTISASYNDTLWQTISVPPEWFTTPTSGDIGTHLFSHLSGSIKYRKTFYEIRYSNFAVENI